jgi:hypothetical protein
VSTGAASGFSADAAAAGVTGVVAAGSDFLKREENIGDLVI